MKDYKPKSVDEFRKIAKWISTSYDELDNKVADPDRESFFNDLIDATSEDQVNIFDEIPTADVLHYYSNGLPDKGKTKDFLDNFEHFQIAFKRILKRYS